MATLAELVFAEEFSQLKQIADSKNWPLYKTGEPGFILGLPAKDDSMFYLKVDCENYSQIPPAWHWFSRDSNLTDKPTDTPIGQGGYFHGSGYICAPWNRLTYKEVNPSGPHGDWRLANWKTNPYTGSCTTLSAMALRISVELKSIRYQRRAA